MLLIFCPKEALLPLCTDKIRKKKKEEKEKELVITCCTIYYK